MYGGTGSVESPGMILVTDKAKKLNPIEVLIGGVLFLIVAVAKGVNSTYEAIVAWRHYDFPAKFVAAWYFFGFIAPARGIFAWICLPWQAIYVQRAMPYPHIDLIVASIATALNLVCTFLAAFWIIRLAIRALGRRTVPILLLVLFSPIGAWGGWLFLQWLIER